MKESQETKISLKKIYEDYESDPLKDTEEIYTLKEAIKDLSISDKAMILLYADLGSIYRVGALLKVHPTTVYSNIKRIREVIKDKIGKKENL